MVYLIFYDMADEGRRRKIAHMLESYGLRVQLSVFECVLDEKQYEVLSHKILRIINKKEDQVRCYPISETARKKVIILGIKPKFAVDSPGFIV